jgi:hypothetical protein
MQRPTVDSSLQPACACMLARLSWAELKRFHTGISALEELIANADAISNNTELLRSYTTVIKSNKASLKS